MQRELAVRLDAGLLLMTRCGNQKHYQTNTAAPVFAELRGLVLKTKDLADVLLAALAPLEAQISAAFVYGSMAEQHDTAATQNLVNRHRAQLNFSACVHPKPCPYTARKSARLR